MNIKMPLIFSFVLEDLTALPTAVDWGWLVDDGAILSMGGCMKGKKLSVLENLIAFWASESAVCR